MANTWFRTKPEYGNAVASVDRENRIIYGVSVCTEGEAKGHGVNLESEFIDNVVSFGNSWKTGVKSRFGHPSMSAEALGTAVGKFKSFRREDKKAIADIHFYKDVKGADEKIEYILDLAEEDPKNFATSIVFTMGDVYKRNNDGVKIYPKKDKYGFIDDEKWESIKSKPFAEIKKLHAVDFVDEPAANPDGLFSSNTLAEQAYNFLEENPKIYELLQKKPSKLFEYLKTYSELKGENNMPDVAELNAEFEQYKQDKETELQGFKAKFEAKDAEILKLSAEIAEIKKANKDAMIASFVAKLPEDAEKRESVKAELEETYESVGEAKFARFAELIIKENDTRIEVPKVGDINLNNADVLKPMTVAEFAELQNKLQYNKKEK